MTDKLDDLRRAALRLDELKDAELLAECARVRAKAAREQAEVEYDRALDAVSKQPVE